MIVLEPTGDSGRIYLFLSNEAGRDSVKQPMVRESYISVGLGLKLGLGFELGLGLFLTWG